MPVKELGFFVEVGTDGDGHVRLIFPNNQSETEGARQMTFSTKQARVLARTLYSKARLADVEYTTSRKKAE